MRMLAMRVLSKCAISQWKSPEYFGHVWPLLRACCWATDQISHHALLAGPGSRHCPEVAVQSGGSAPGEKSLKYMKLHLALGCTALW